MAETNRGGRPSKYSEAMATQICVRIADGESLRSICGDKDMPDKATVLRWLADGEHDSFRDQYVCAREAQADALVEECLEISDDGSNDWMERKNADGQNVGWTLNGEHVQRSRLRVDTRKWWAARLAPKKYGDRVMQEHSGPDGGPIQTEELSAREFIASRMSGLAARKAKSGDTGRSDGKAS